MSELTFISGKKGSGKSLLMIIFAFYSQNFTNIIMNFPNKLEKATKFELGLFISDFYTKATIFLDEAYLLLDSRNSGSNINKNMSYELFQIRHTDINIFLATQLEITIELRFRLQIDNLIKCYRYPNSLKVQPEYFQYEFITQDSNDVWILPYEKAKVFFPLYNTKERINQENLTDSKLKIIKQTNPQQFCLMSKDIAKEIYLRKKGEVLTHEEIFLELQDLNKSQLFENNVYILCKKWKKEKLEKLNKKSKKESTHFSYYKRKYIDSELAEEKTIQDITKRMKRKR